MSIPPESVQLGSAAVTRISLYLRELRRLAEIDVTSVNSGQLARAIDVSPAVVRKDLAAIGAAGRRGVGYSIPALCERIGATLGSEITWRVVLVGAGSLGHALLRYRGFESQGFQFVAAFDANPRLVGRSVGGLVIRAADQMGSAIAELAPQLAIIAVPAEAAAEVARELAASGIAGILNFSPISLKLPKRVAQVNVDLASEIQRLAFAVSRTPAEKTAHLPAAPDAPAGGTAKKKSKNRPFRETEPNAD